MSVGAVSSACDALSGNLFTNCGFEAGGDYGTAAGWEVLDEPGWPYYITGSDVHSGTYSASFGSPYNPTTIRQAITVTQGATYDLQFHLTSGGDATGSRFGAYLIEGQNGARLFGYQDQGVTGWQLHSRLFTASGSSLTLEFSFRHPEGAWYFDDVSLVRVDVTNVAASRSKGVTTVTFDSYSSGLSYACSFDGAKSYRPCVSGDRIRSGAKEVWVRASADGGLNYGPAVSTMVTRG